MGAPGKSVVIEGGKRGVLLGGKSAVYNSEETCPACCIEFSRRWSFTDQGFIDGGQGGAYRAYDDPDDVPMSPWYILDEGLGLKLTWEYDNNCKNHNPYTQYATATCEITVPKAMIMTVNWSGMGETQDPNYELMSLYVNGNLVGSAHAHVGFNPGLFTGSYPVLHIAVNVQAGYSVPVQFCCVWVLPRTPFLIVAGAGQATKHSVATVAPFGEEPFSGHGTSQPV